MKKLFILLACAATMVACSKDEVLEVNKGQAISFSSPFVNKATRAELVTTANLTGFDVWGTVTGTGGTELIFNKTPIVKDGSVWVCENEADVQYWVPAADYAFTAIKNYTTVDQVAGQMPTAINATVNTTTGAADLILAQENVTDAVADQAAVGLTFSHLMSKVAFTVTSNAENGYTHTVRDITVENFSNGKYTIGTGAWGSTTDASIKFGDIEDVDDTTGKSNAPLLLIPNTASFKVSFVVDFEKNGTTLRTVEYTGVNAITVNSALVAGQSYNFTIGLSAGNPIQFTATVTPWTDPATDVPVLP